MEEINAKLIKSVHENLTSVTMENTHIVDSPTNIFVMPATPKASDVTGHGTSITIPHLLQTDLVNRHIYTNSKIKHRQKSLI